MQLSDVTKGSRIFNAHFVDEINKADHGLNNISSFVSQNYTDEEANFMSTKDPTFQFLS